jgi:hypothetical protein
MWGIEEEKIQKWQRIKNEFSKIKEKLFNHWTNLDFVLITVGDAVWIKNKQDDTMFIDFIEKVIGEHLYSHAGIIPIDKNTSPPNNLEFSRGLLKLFRRRTSGNSGPVFLVKRKNRSTNDVPWETQCDASFHFSLREHNELVMDINKFVPDQTLVGSQQWVVPVSIEH